jgi:hypothetical protein
MCSELNDYNYYTQRKVSMNMYFNYLKRDMKRLSILGGVRMRSNNQPTETRNTRKRNRAHNDLIHKDSHECQY